MEIFLKNVQQYGLHYGASRKSNVALEVYPQAEEWLSQWVGSEACVTLSSGYLAAQLVVQTLLQKGHSLFAAPNAHTALLVHGVVQTQSFEELHQHLTQILEEDPKGNPPVILFDTLDFSGGQFPNFEALRELPLEKIILVGDDSHGIGIVGEQDKGCYTMLKNLNPAQLMVCCSLGKGLGIQAGAVLGTANSIQMLRNTAFYGGASPAPPAFMGTLLDAGPIYRERRATVMEHLELFKKSLHSLETFTHIEGHPSFEFSNPELAKSLEKNGFVFTNFNYPDENGPIVSRIVLSAYHLKEDILQLTNGLNRLMR
jgi:7-keto-8-aminopelargonate synthetase-like enzyme